MQHHYGKGLCVQRVDAQVLPSFCQSELVGIVITQLLLMALASAHLDCLHDDFMLSCCHLSWQHSAL